MWPAVLYKDDNDVDSDKDTNNIYGNAAQSH